MKPNPHGTTPQPSRVTGAKGPNALPGNAPQRGNTGPMHKVKPVEGLHRRGRGDGGVKGGYGATDYKPVKTGMSGGEPATKSYPTIP